jgi:hypothetical protein
MALSTGKVAVCLMAAIICAMIAPLGFVCAASADYQDLVNLTLNNEDTRMNAVDLAFLLATHDFDATPKGGYAVVRINSTVYKLTPNGDEPGLVDIAIMK